MIVILDEFWQARIASASVKPTVTDSSGGKPQQITVSGEKFFEMVVNQILTLGRSFGIAMILTTQSAKAEILTPGIKSNCTAIVGGVDTMSPQLLQAVVPTSVVQAERQLAYAVTGQANTHLNLPNTFLFSAPVSTGVYFLRHDGKYVRNNDVTTYPSDPPRWDVMLPYFRPGIDFPDHSAVRKIDEERLLADIQAAYQREESRAVLDTLGKEVQSDWLRAMGIRGFNRWDRIPCFWQSISAPLSCKHGDPNCRVKTRRLRQIKFWRNVDPAVLQPIAQN